MYRRIVLENSYCIATNSNILTCSKCVVHGSCHEKIARTTKPARDAAKLQESTYIKFDEDAHLQSKLHTREQAAVISQLRWFAISTKSVIAILSLNE